MIKNILFQVLQGLVFLKQARIIHCDLKPENIMFKDNSYDEIAILDFGAACTTC